jgi:uncharacterized membrane protein YhhN
MYIWLILAILFAVLETVAVWRDLRRLEYIAKPLVMVCLFLWLYTATGLQGDTFWFALGILFSLAGDVFLMVSLERFFLPGLVAFLFAHISYILGFRDVLLTVNLWSLLLALILATNVARLLRRITGAMRAKGEDRLVAPVILYGAIISFMLYSAMSTINATQWKNGAALLVSAGALLFWASDLVLAWDRFVMPLQHRRWNIVLYYLGQIGLVAGVIDQFG